MNVKLALLECQLTSFESSVVDDSNRDSFGLSNDPMPLFSISPVCPSSVGDWLGSQWSIYRHGINSEAVLIVQFVLLRWS